MRAAGSARADAPTRRAAVTKNQKTGNPGNPW